MRRALPLLAVAGLLAACSDSSLPTNPEAPQLGASSTGTYGCSIYTMRQATSALFGHGSPEIAIAKLITADNIKSPTATNAGFDLMAAVSALRGATPGWSEAQSGAAANLTLQLIPCMDVVTSAPVSTGQLVAALAGPGTYQVRGGLPDPADNVLSWDAKAGVKPPVAFAEWLGGRALFIGHPITTFATEQSGGYAYDWVTIRAIPRPATAPAPFTVPAIVALCADDAPDGLTGDELRVQYLAKAAGGWILPIAAGDFVQCASETSALRAAPGSFGARLAQALVELVRPAPLFASAAAAGGIGGLSTSFSPYEVIFPGEVKLGFGAAPAEARANQPIRGVDGGVITVLVTGQQGTPWKEVLVRITGRVNNASKLAFCGNEAVTNSAGIASFPNLTANKPGGLHLVATTVQEAEDPDVTSFAPAAVESPTFHVKNSKTPSPC